MPKAPPKSTTHLHACPQCNDTFLCACPERTVDPRCIPCIGNLGDSLIARGRRASPCCLTQIRRPRADEVKTYRLAGTQPWWFCGECKKAFNHQPKESFPL